MAVKVSWPLGGSPRSARMLRIPHSLHFCGPVWKGWGGCVCVWEGGSGVQPRVVADAPLLALPRCWVQVCVVGGWGLAGRTHARTHAPTHPSTTSPTPPLTASASSSLSTGMLVQVRCIIVSTPTWRKLRGGWVGGGVGRWASGGAGVQRAGRESEAFRAPPPPPLPAVRPWPPSLCRRCRWWCRAHQKQQQQQQRERARRRAPWRSGIADAGLVGDHGVAGSSAL